MPIQLSPDKADSTPAQESLVYDQAWFDVRIQLENVGTTQLTSSLTTVLRKVAVDSQGIFYVSDKPPVTDVIPDIFAAAAHDPEGAQVIGAFLVWLQNRFTNLGVI